MEFVGNQYAIPFLQIQELAQQPLFRLQQLSRRPVLGFLCLQHRKLAMHLGHFDD